MFMFLQIKQQPKGWYLKATWKKIMHSTPQLQPKMSLFETSYTWGFNPHLKSRISGKGTGTFI